MSRFKTLNNGSPKLIGNHEKGLVFVISAPAGTGKTTLTERLCREFKGQIQESISCTTRSKRVNESEGLHYHFINHDQFKEKIQTDAFLEYAEVFDHYYGTLKTEISAPLEKGIHVVLVIDTQGAMKIRDLIDAVFIFIAPPTLDELERRLRKRQTESEEMIEKRLKWAEKEITYAEHYDYFIINQDLEVAYQALKSIVIAEEHRNRDV